MLPNGITGFRNLKDPYIPEQEKRIFQRFCYSIATRYHCEVLSFDLDLASKNFYSAEIKTEQGRFYGEIFALPKFIENILNTPL